MRRRLHPANCKVVSHDFSTLICLSKNKIMTAAGESLAASSLLAGSLAREAFGWAENPHSRSPPSSEAAGFGFPRGV